MLHIYFSHLAEYGPLTAYMLGRTLGVPMEQIKYSLLLFNVCTISEVWVIAFLEVAKNSQGKIHFNRIGNNVKIRLSIDFHQLNFMKPERMNLKYLLIIWINYDSS